LNERQNFARQETSSARDTSRYHRSDLLTPRSSLSAATFPVLIISILTVFGVIAYLFTGTSPDGEENQRSAGTQQTESVKAVPGLIPRQQTSVPSAKPKSSTQVSAPSNPEIANTITVKQQAANNAELLKLRADAEQRFEQRVAETAIQRAPLEQSTDSNPPASIADDSAAEEIATESSRFEEESMPAEPAQDALRAVSPDAFDPTTE
jgi:hypothetical protein